MNVIQSEFCLKYEYLIMGFMICLDSGVRRIFSRGGGGVNILKSGQKFRNDSARRWISGGGGGGLEDTFLGHTVKK